MNGIVVVGVDGSPNSRAALLRALAEAAGRASGLRIVYVRPRGFDEHGAASRRIGAVALNDATALVLDAAPHLTVDKRLLTGDPALELMLSASGADLLVVGARGGGLTGAPLGWTTRRLAAEACLPLEVVGLESRRVHHRIALGVDPRHPDSASTRYAFEAARRTGARLALVCVDRGPLGTGNSASGGDAREQYRKKQEAALSRFADLWSARYPRTRISLRPVVGMGDNALIAASVGADLLVVGSERPQGPAGRGGSEADAVLRYAACPVVLVPYPAPPGRS